MPQRAYRVRGLVQGVGFRWWTRSQAQALNLDGSVRNCADGSVEVHASGDEQAMEELLRLLRQGPAGAQVSAVEEMEPRLVTRGGFRIERD